MKQHEAVIKAMQDNGGYATLAYLYQNVLKIKECNWKTKTPLASIRRIVQDNRFFFRIRPGLWALNSFKNRLPPEIFPSNKVSEIQQEILGHSYYQGLLIEIGNLKNYETFVPSQDRNRQFLNRRLGEIATLQNYYQFSYENLVRRAQTIDVSWFNERKMPFSLFEIEYSTDFHKSLLKFNELQDFNVIFYIVSDKRRKEEFKEKISFNAFGPIRSRVNHIDFDKLSDWHSKTFEIVTLEKEMFTY
jgi:hypothetical protein